jgi:5S rRNA maturation endonuclease (ribonuclease M5)
LEVALALVPDLFTLAALLDWPIRGPGTTFAWFRGNTNTPSLRIDDDGQRWYDFREGKGGGPIQLLARVEDLDNKAACRRFMQIAGKVAQKLTHDELMAVYAGASVSSTRDTAERRAIAASERREAEQSEWRSKWEMIAPFKEPSDECLDQILQIRGWPRLAIQGLRHARSIGILFAERWYGQPGFVVTDSRRLSAKVRRLDGLVYSTGAKAKALPGSVGNWPLGAEGIRNQDRVILVEGETDQLAMYSLMAMYAPGSLARTTVVSLSAGSRIHELATHRIKERASCVILIADNDDAGHAAVGRWTEQLTDAGVPVSTASVAGIAEGVKDVSDLLGKLDQFPNLDRRLGDWVGSLTEATDLQPTDQ